MTSRRATLKAMALGAAGMATGMLGLPAWLPRAQAQSQSTDPDAGASFRSPPIHRGTLADGVRRLDLNLQQGTSEFFPGVATPTIGINGSFLGPTLRMTRDDRVQFVVHNQLDEPTAIHWHGLHVPPDCDGGPRQVVQPGESWEPRVRILQSAGTFWYHSHMMHKTGEQVYRGLAGMLIVDDAESESLDLPREYGVDDIPVIIQDRRFKADGSLEYMSRYEDLVQGMQGDTILVNGVVSPVFSPARGRIRLRVLNAANARKFMLAFSDRREFHVIASDGGLLPAPVPMTSLMLASGERVEIVVDFSDGQPVKLVNAPMRSSYPDSPGAMSQILRAMGTQAFDIMTFRPASGLMPGPALPVRLASLDRIPEEQASRTRQFRLQMGAGSRSGGDRGPGTGHRNGFGGGHGGGNYYINGRQMDMHFINERIKLGDIEIWEVFNDSPMPHPFHVHAGQFQILDRNGEPPPAHELGYKDTVLVQARERVRIIMRFTDFSDPENTYMYHCHMLEHEDRGMMGQFLVV